MDQQPPQPQAIVSTETVQRLNLYLDSALLVTSMKDLDPTIMFSLTGTTAQRLIDATSTFVSFSHQNNTVDVNPLYRAHLRALTHLSAEINSSIHSKIRSIDQLL